MQHVGLNKANAVALSTDARWLATANFEGAVRLWTPDGRVVGQDLRHRFRRIGDGVRPGFGTPGGGLQ